MYHHIIQLTHEKHRFELRKSIYVDFFSTNICIVFYLWGLQMREANCMH